MTSVKKYDCYTHNEYKRDYQNAKKHNLSILCVCGGTFTIKNRAKHEHSEMHVEYEKGEGITRCPCGGRYGEKNKAGHFKTKRHLEFESKFQ